MKEAKTSNNKRKLIAAISSIVLCMLLIGVSVYAALSQTATVTNTISITQSGQSLVSISVDKASNAATTAYSADTGANVGTYTNILTVTPGSNGTKTDDNFVFSQTTGINAYAYKITLNNTSTTTAATYSISLFNANTTDAYVAPNGVTLGKAIGEENIEEYSAQTGRLEATESATIYIVFYTNQALGDLSPDEGKTFDLAISIQAV